MRTPWAFACVLSWGVLFAVGPARAEWHLDGVPASTGATNQASPKAISDGAGGAILVWSDTRTGSSGADIYAQRLDKWGNPLWGAAGVALCTAAGGQVSPEIVPDGAGGAIVVWQDIRSATHYDIYAQRISAAGNPLWSADGLALCTATGDQTDPRAIPDGSGGAIVVWIDSRGGSYTDIYAQRVASWGVPVWEADGVAVCTAYQNQLFPAIASDGSGGAIIVWQDARSAGSSDNDIYAQRVDAAGYIQWSSNGMAVCTAAGNQYSPTLATDGDGNAIVAWEDVRSFSYTIYAQRVEGRYGYWGHPEPELASVADVPEDQGGKVAVNWKASGRDLATPRPSGTTRSGGRWTRFPSRAAER
jgi:hypothetical protein